MRRVHTLPRLPLHTTRVIKMTDLAASTSMAQLEAALLTNGVEVPDGAVQRLLDQKQWIYRSLRVENLRRRLTEDQLYSVFSAEHHISSAARLFEFLKGEYCAVVYGHKAEGKTQFLFFVFKLLQAMGEKVLYLDRTFLPSTATEKIEVNSDRFCGNLWKDSFQIEGPVKDALNKFLEDGLPRSFQGFFFKLRNYAERSQSSKTPESTRMAQSPQSSKTRIWVIVDDVDLFEKLIKLPDEDDIRPFKWIVAGSARVGSMVYSRHLERLMFDMPRFTQQQCFDFASKLCNYLDINLEDELAVPMEGVSDWLEEHFGGLVGYIAETFLDVAEGRPNAVSQNLLILRERVYAIITESARDHRISDIALAQYWLCDIKRWDSTWISLRYAGLCGRHDGPRGIIFSFILEWLYSRCREEDALRLVTYFRSMISEDPGLHECLLKQEEIWKLRAGKSFEASLFTHKGQKWITSGSLNLPSQETLASVNVLAYDERYSSVFPISPSTSSSWSVILIPDWFDVIDVVLVDSSSAAKIYGIQITQSVDPSAKHYTFDTCPQRSKDRLHKLWNVIARYFKQKLETVYVMRAPNCESFEFKPSEGQKSALYFAPSSSSKRRRAHSSSSKKKSE